MAIYGKGIYEKGKHQAKIGQKHTKEYLVWRTMINRCYNPKYLEKHPTYKKCEVCDEWLYFQEFCKWFENNYYSINGEIIDLDKDFICGIKHIDNKIYSPDTCIFVPQRINKMITHQSVKSTNLPTGVKRTRNKNIYNVMVNNKYVGRYDSVEEAFFNYIKAKNKELKDAVMSYDNIPKNVKEIIIEYANKNILVENCLNTDTLLLTKLIGNGLKKSLIKQNK